nr:uncharacterized protein LOC127346572 [Lolium perenne]
MELSQAFGFSALQAKSPRFLPQSRPVPSPPPLPPYSPQSRLVSSPPLTEKTKTTRLLRRPSPPILAAARSSGRPRPSSSPDIPTGSRRAPLGEGFGGATVDGLMANCDGCGFMATLQRREPLPADGEVELHRQWHVQIVSRRSMVTDREERDGKGKKPRILNDDKNG